MNTVEVEITGMLDMEGETLIQCDSFSTRVLIWLHF